MSCQVDFALVVRRLVVACKTADAEDDGEENDVEDEGDNTPEDNEPKGDGSGI